MTKSKKPNASTRPIRSVFYFGKRIVKVNRASYPEMAVLHCIRHMRANKYEATVAEVFDEDNGTLFAVIRSTQKGLSIVWNYEPTPELMSYYLVNKKASIKPSITQEMVIH